MTTRPGGLWPKGILKVALGVPLAILGIYLVYRLAGVLERAFSKLSPGLQLFILAAAVVAVLCERRYFASDRAARDLERVRAKAARSSAEVQGVPAATPAPAAVPSRPERDNSRFVDQVRQEASRADAYVGPALADAVARVNSILSLERAEFERRQMRTERAVSEVRGAVAGDTAELAHVVSEVTSMCVTVVSYLEESRRQTRALTQAVSRLSLPPSPAREVPAPTIDGSDERSLPPSDDRVISIVDDEDLAAERSSEVLLRENGRWVGGVEILDLTGANGTSRYWLRRKSDGYIFPRAFEEHDLQFPLDAPAEETAGNVTR